MFKLCKSSKIWLEESNNSYQTDLKQNYISSATDYNLCSWETSSTARKWQFSRHISASGLEESLLLSSLKLSYIPAILHRSWNTNTMAKPKHANTKIHNSLKPKREKMVQTITMFQIILSVLWIYSHYIFLFMCRLVNKLYIQSFHMLSTMKHQLYSKFTSKIFCFITQSHWGWAVKFSVSYHKVIWDGWK